MLLLTSIFFVMNPITMFDRYISYFRNVKIGEIISYEVIFNFNFSNEQQAVKKSVFYKLLLKSNKSSF